MTDYVADIARLPADELSARLESRVDAVSGPRRSDAYLDGQRLLYLLYVARIQPPWLCVVPAVHDPAVAATFLRLEAAWNQVQTDAVLTSVQAPDVASFEAWLIERCRTHASGPQHPLFTLMKESADEQALREFVFQETPFDIHFGDLVAMLVPGIYGAAKIELAENFWDEMGGGNVTRTHRQLRLTMMQAVGVAEDSYLTGIERFWVEELELANLYFSVCSSRRLMDQALGMLLATEHVVPGRIDHQLSGWLRLGYREDQLEYLSEHIVVDVEHAAGWLNEVVKPTLSSHPEYLRGIVAGVECRLAASLRVCDRALDEFQGQPN
jgi:pyrroloquinoline quinone (PQQ) biosynthesis protein C